MRKNITSVYYVQPRRTTTTNKYHTNCHFTLHEDEDPEEVSLIPKNIAKSILIPAKTKKPLPFVISDPTKINSQHLKHIIKLNFLKNQPIKDVRHYFAKVLISYNFSSLKELDLSKSNLIL